MTSLRNLDDFVDDSLKLPIGGKTYVVPGPDAATGIMCQRLMTAGARAHAGMDIGDISIDLDDEEEDAFFRRVLGPAYEQMVADGVSWPRLKHAALTAFFWIAMDDDTAKAFWEGKRRGPTPKPAATSTQNPASRNGTSRKKSRARRSRGGRSSNTGRS
ncbi:MAG: DUF7426 family protein [Micromonosporaceae bacterium]